ncbi:MAG: hypothetical protein QXE31_04010 [Candidatus Woesearchaeota archaeon]
MNNTNKLIFFITLFVLASCTLMETPKDNTPRLLSQWAVSATASDSYGGSGQNIDDQSAYAATGKPNVKNCENSNYAWTISRENDGIHWIELNYDIPVYVNKVRVYENFNPGSVIKIELKKDNGYETLWQGTYKTKQCPYVLEKEYRSLEGNITKNITSYKTDTIRITVDTDVPGWNEIDAVELIGYEKKFTILNGTIVFENED